MTKIKARWILYDFYDVSNILENTEVSQEITFCHEYKQFSIKSSRHKGIFNFL